MKLFLFFKNLCFFSSSKQPRFVPKELDVFVYGKNGVLFLLIFLLPKSVPLEELQMSYTKIYLFLFFIFCKKSAMFSDVAFSFTFLVGVGVTAAVQNLISGSESVDFLWKFQSVSLKGKCVLGSERFFKFNFMICFLSSLAGFCPVQVQKICRFLTVSSLQCVSSGTW